MFKGDLMWSSAEFQRIHDAATQPDPRWHGQEIRYWAEWREGGNERHAVMLLDDGTRLVIHEDVDDTTQLDERK